MSIRIDPSQLTLQETAELCEACNCTLEQAMSGPKQARAMGMLAWFFARRSDPTFTLEQAMRLKMDDLEIVVPDSPTNANNGDSLPSLADSTA